MLVFFLEDFVENMVDEEDFEDYCKGGYYFVMVGELFKDGKYIVVCKLGWGYFLIVWLLRDIIIGKYVVFKVVRFVVYYIEIVIDEIKFFNKIV